MQNHSVVSDVRIAYLCSANMYTKLVQVLHFEMLLTSCSEKTNELSLSHAIVRLCSQQCSNILDRQTDDF